MRYWLYPFPTDMRKGFYTLSGLVTDQMGGDVRSGDVFIFINRHCTSIKLLHMENGGMVIYYMKHEDRTDVDALKSSYEQTISLKDEKILDLEKQVAYLKRRI